jgi:tetratricopeptide (TPR) repeat protein
MTAKENNQQKHGAHEELPEIVVQAREVMRRYWRIALIIILVVGAGTYYYYRQSSQRQTQAYNAWSALNSMPPIHALEGKDQAKQLESIITQCDDILAASSQRTSATPWVHLKLANALRAADDPQGATEHYRIVIEKWPNATTGHFARIGLASLLDTEGDHAEAAELYETLAARAGKASPFWLDAGRNYELVDKRESAMKAYNTLGENGDGEVAAHAMARYRSLSAGGPLLPPPPPEKKATPRIESPETTPEKDEETAPEPGPGDEPGGIESNQP